MKALFSKIQQALGIDGQPPSTEDILDLIWLGGHISSHLTIPEPPKENDSAGLPLDKTNKGGAKEGKGDSESEKVN